MFKEFIVPWLHGTVNASEVSSSDNLLLPSNPLPKSLSSLLFGESPLLLASNVPYIYVHRDYRIP